MGLYFFKNEDKNKFIVNHHLYRAMIYNFLLFKIHELNLGSLWFQLASAIFHIVHETIDLLHNVFGEQFTSRFGLVN